MKEVIATGKTVEEAVENGCTELGATLAEVTYEVLEVPVKKLFKFIPAKVKVSLLSIEEEAPAPAPVVQSEPKPAAPAAQPQSQPARSSNVLVEEPEIPVDLNENAPAAMAVAYLLEIFGAMGAGQPNIEVVKQGEATLLRVEGSSLLDVIDIKGDVVQALSYLTDRAVNKGIDKKDPNYLRVRLDIAGYRNRRESELVNLAQKIGAEVNRTHRSRTLEPMNAYERLIVHTTISKIEGLISESVGADATRRVVIKSTAADATDGEDWRPPRKGGNNRRDNRNGGGNRGGYRDGHKGGNNRRPPRGGSGGGRPNNTPGREYANRPRTQQQSAPVAPARREAIRDGEDLPLYGKIDI